MVSPLQFFNPNIRCAMQSYENYQVWRVYYRMNSTPKNIRRDGPILSAPIAQSGERWIAELTGSESPVRAASVLAVCS